MSVDPSFAEQVRAVLADTLALPPEFVSYLQDHQLVHGRVNESNLGFFDTTAQNANTKNHGLLPKLAGTGVKFLRDDGTWVQFPGGFPSGPYVKLYDFTVAGADKVSIDTGVDTPDSGTNDWTVGDVIEIWMVNRTDAAAASDSVSVNFNNDSGANYYNQAVAGGSTTVVAVSSVSQTSLSFGTHGSGGSASFPGIWRITIPNFRGTTFFKIGEASIGRNDTNSTLQSIGLEVVTWGSTSAISRLKVSGQAGQKLKVGSRLIIYTR